MKYSKLNNFHARRRFDPDKKQDLHELKYFLEHTTWKHGCPFFLEDPSEDIPAMCKDKFALSKLSKMKY
jgi:hypothetical protein